MQASSTLQSRLLENPQGLGSAAACVGPITGHLLHRVGALLASDSPDIAWPMANTAGVLRFTRDIRPNDIAQGFNALIALTVDYLRNLPGASDAIVRRAWSALRHAGLVTLQLQKALLSGEPSPELVRSFGGAAILAVSTRPAGAAERAERTETRVSIV
jgi:hypothetical protein